MPAPLWDALAEAYRDAEIRFPALKVATLAQWAIESGRGTSRLARQHLNFGGIKYRERMAGYATPVEYKAHDDVALYCRFADLPAFVAGYWHFIASGKYEGWEQLGNDPLGYIAHLKKKGYAEDPRYFEKVLALLPQAEAWLHPHGAPLLEGPSMQRFNSYILKSVERLQRERAGGGYDINSYFTRDLTYGRDCCIRANHPPLTMCVAAVSEVIIEALNIYAHETSDMAPFKALPIRSWQRGSRQDIRAHIFQYAGTGSRGTAHALSRFGVGREAPFEALVPGDFVTFNRTSGSGHTAVFLSYIDDRYQDLGAYSERVAGFRYFSAQGKGRPDAGFAQRWAFFSPVCRPAPAGKVRDCGVIRSSKQSLLNTGFMLHPAAWSVQSALNDLRDEIRAEVYADLVGRPLGQLEGTAIAEDALADAVGRELERELESTDLSRYDGVERD